MEPERFRRVEELFHRALELPAHGRDAFLEGACGADLELHREVMRLLAADARAPEGVETFELLGSEADTLLGRQLGPWRILERLAEGGMGVVYRAERADGIYDRQVAVKLLRVEVATGEALRRFELERRLLARLQHPNIALLIDGGRSEQGIPYLVMELVDGLPIDRWCEQHELALEDRLRLFADVCHAVHFAHQSLIVHRDLKPSNIMIDRRGQPKLLDFGIARLLDDPGSLPTETAARQLTPQYASPEQLQGSSLTTATDVYSLGVVLYELLTGRGPWRRTGKSPADWERIVSREQPTRPSTAVQLRDAEQGSPAASFAAHLRTTPARLHRKLRGDLDRIVLMALRKEPERRYASAEQLAEDLERHLADLPVRARPDTLGYRTRRFVKRHRLAVVAAAAVLLALCGGLFASWRARLQAEAAAEVARVQEARAEAAAEVARAEKSRAEVAAEVARVQEARAEDAAEVARAEKARAEDAAEVARTEKARAEAAAEVARTEKARAEAAAEVARAEKARAVHTAEHARIEADSFRLIAEVMGDTLLRSASDEGTRRMVAEAFERYAEQVRREHADHPHLRANLLDALGRAHSQLDLFAPAEGLMGEARNIRLETFGPETMEHALSLGSLGQLAYRRGAFAEAAEALEAALALHRAFPEDVHSDVAHAANDLAASLRRLGRVEEARALHEEALALRRRSGDGGTLAVSESLNNLALVLLDQREAERARELIEEGLDIRQRILGPHHPLTLQMLSSLAGVEWQLGRPDEARPHLQAAVAGYRELGEGGREGLVHALANLSAVHIRRGELEQAELAAGEVLELALERHGRDHLQVALARSRLAAIHAERDQQEEAQAAWREVLRVRRLAYPADHPLLAQTLNHLANALVQGGAAAEAEPLLEEAARILEGAGDPARLGPELALVELTRGVCALRLDRPEEARRRLESARDAFTRLEGEASPGAQRARNYLALLEGSSQER